MMIALTSSIKTPYHRWPAGAKLGALVLFTLVLFWMQSPWLRLCMCGGVLGLYLAAGSTFTREGLRLLRPLWLFLAVLLVWHIATNSPTDGARVALGLLGAVGLANLVTLTTRLDDMIAVLRRLTSPLRRLGVNTRPLEIAIAMVVRFTPTLFEKGQALALAWRARSPRRPGWRIVTPFTLLAIDDAEHVAEALRARGGVAQPVIPPKDTA